jgi:CheY-like chemotaxis protein
MIAGDDEAWDMYALFLRRAGFDVLTARSRDEAHRIAGSKRERVDLIVADFLVPEDAIAAIDEMQADPRTWNIPILVLTLLSRDAALGAARAAGASGIMSKPCLPQNLATEIRHMLAFAEDAPVVRRSLFRIA